MVQKKQQRIFLLYRSIGVGSGGPGGTGPLACQNALISRQNFGQFLIFRVSLSKCFYIF